MSGGVMVIVGLVLALAGIWSARVALVAAGAGATWLVADAFGAGAAAGLLWALLGGGLALGLALVAARILFFVVGLVIGAVVGARLFATLDTGDASILLAAFFVPSMALLGGVAIERWRQRMVAWATAIAGAGLVLSGLAQIAPRALGFLGDPLSTGEQLFTTLVWIGSAVAARLAQKGLERGDRTAATAA
jgi:hypothetical protein